MLHASPLGIPRQKKCPPNFFNIFYHKIGQIIWEHMSEVLGVGAFREIAVFNFYNVKIWPIFAGFESSLPSRSIFFYFLD